MRICEKCGKRYTEHPALSRADNKSLICEECGIKEALDDAGIVEGSSLREVILETVRNHEQKERTS